MQPRTRAALGDNFILCLCAKQSARLRRARAGLVAQKQHPQRSLYRSRADQRQVDVDARYSYRNRKIWICDHDSSSTLNS